MKNHYDIKTNLSYNGVTRETHSVRGSRGSTAPWSSNSNYSKNVHGIDLVRHK